MESLNITPENCLKYKVKEIKASQLYKNLPNKSRYTTKNAICSAIVAHYRGIRSSISSPGHLSQQSNELKVLNSYVSQVPLINPYATFQQRNISSNVPQQSSFKSFLPIMSSNVLQQPSFKPLLSSNVPQQSSFKPLQPLQSSNVPQQSSFKPLQPLQSSNVPQQSSFKPLQPLQSSNTSSLQQQLQQQQTFQIRQSLKQQTQGSISVIEPSQRQMKSMQLQLIQPSQTKIQQYQLQIPRQEQLNTEQCDLSNPNNVRNVSENTFKQSQTLEQFLTLWGSFYLNQICIPTYSGTFVGTEDNEAATFEMGGKFIEMIRYGLVPIDSEITENNLRYKYGYRFLALGIDPSTIDDVQWGYVMAFVPKNILIRLSNLLNTYDNIESIYIELDTGINNLQQIFLSNNTLDYFMDQETAIDSMDMIRTWLNESVKRSFNIQNYGFISVWNTLATSPADYVFDTIIHALQSL